MGRLTVDDTELPAVVYASGSEFTCELPDLSEVNEALPGVARGDRAVVTDHQGEDWNGIVVSVSAEDRTVVVNAERRNWR